MALSTRQIESVLRTLQVRGGRGCGKTDIVANAVKRSPDAILVVHNEQFRGQIIDKYGIDPSRVVTLEAIGPNLQGKSSVPVIVDHYANEQMMNLAMSTIEAQNTMLQSARARIAKIDADVRALKQVLGMNHSAHTSPADLCTASAKAETTAAPIV